MTDGTYVARNAEAVGISRDNNFDVIRLLAALQVAVLHACHHLDAGLPEGVRRFLELFPGVPIFFFISGLLVTSSLMRRPLASYIESRARRILPALWLAFALAVGLLAAFGQIGTPELSSLQFWLWAVGQATLFQIFSPDMFRDFGVGVVNGSLWTIPVEIGFYVLLPILLWLATFTGQPDARNRRLTILLTSGGVISFAIYAVVWPAIDNEPVLVKVISASPAAHLWQFALGALTYIHRSRVLGLVETLKRIPAGWAAPLVAYAALGWWVAPSIPVDVFSALGYPLLMFGVLSAALAAPSWAKLLRGYDISYGLYLYHMLAVNAAVAMGFRGNGEAAAAAVVVSVMMAMASWRFVEAPLLRRPGIAST